LQIVADLLGGYWEKPLSKWEGRRDGVLDLIGKATPGTFQPSLQIDGTGATLLIEALSGRWSYDTERREKRTVWYHVANAFSLRVSTIAPMPSDEKNQGDLKLQRVTFGPGPPLFLSNFHLLINIVTG